MKATLFYLVLGIGAFNPVLANLPTIRALPKRLDSESENFRLYRDKEAVNRFYITPTRYLAKQTLRDSRLPVNACEKVKIYEDARTGLLKLTMKTLQLRIQQRDNATLVSKQVTEREALSVQETKWNAEVAAFQNEQPVNAEKLKEAADKLKEVQTQIAQIDTRIANLEKTNRFLEAETEKEWNAVRVLRSEIAVNHEQLKEASGSLGIRLNIEKLPITDVNWLAKYGFRASDSLLIPEIIRLQLKTIDEGLRGDAIDEELRRYLDKPRYNGTFSVADLLNADEIIREGRAFRRPLPPSIDFSRVLSLYDRCNLEGIDLTKELVEGFNLSYAVGVWVDSGVELENGVRIVHADIPMAPKKIEFLKQFLVNDQDDFLTRSEDFGDPVRFLNVGGEVRPEAVSVEVILSQKGSE